MSIFFDNKSYTNVNTVFCLYCSIEKGLAQIRKSVKELALFYVFMTSESTKQKKKPRKEEQKSATKRGW